MVRHISDDCILGNVFTQLNITNHKGETSMETLSSPLNSSRSDKEKRSVIIILKVNRYFFNIKGIRFISGSENWIKTSLMLVELTD